MARTSGGEDGSMSVIHADRIAEAKAAGAKIYEAWAAHALEADRVTCPRCGAQGLVYSEVYSREIPQGGVFLVAADYEIDPLTIIGPPGRWFALEHDRIHECGAR